MAARRGISRCGRVSAAAILAASSLVVAGCGGGSHKYPANAQSNFLNSCEQQGNVSTCDCTLSYIEKHVKFSTFEVYDRAVDQGDTNPPSWALKAASSCR